MPINISDLERENLAEIGQRCRIVSLGKTDKRHNNRKVGDELEIVSKVGSSGGEKFLRFKTIGDTGYANDFFLYSDTVIDRIKD